MAFCYILYSLKIKKYYVGACSDITRRLHEHNIGHSKFTSTGTPWQLVYQTHFPGSTEAKRRESKIKKMKSRIYIEKLLKDDSNMLRDPA